jgi:hypothetical protein
MSPEERQQFNDMQARIQELEQFVQSKQRNQITFPVDDASRKNMGLGFIGKDPTTTVAGSLLVNTNEGPMKILYAL